MIVTSTSEIVPFTPSWRKDEAAPPKFLLRAGSVIERAQMEAELSGQYRASRVFGFELKAAVRGGVLALLVDDPDLEHILELIEAEDDATAAPATDEDKKLLGNVRNVLAEHWPEYRDLVAQLERRRELAPIVALRRFCTGWENATNDKGTPAVFSRGLDGLISDQSLSQLSPLEMMTAGNRAYGLQYADGQEKNSERPSPLEDAPLTSPSPSVSKAGGKSRTTRGKKTQG